MYILTQLRKGPMCAPCSPGVRSSGRTRGGIAWCLDPSGSLEECPLETTSCQGLPTIRQGE